MMIMVLLNYNFIDTCIDMHSNTSHMIQLLYNTCCDIFKCTTLSRSVEHTHLMDMPHVEQAWNSHAINTHGPSVIMVLLFYMSLSSSNNSQLCHLQ